ncbi:MAG: PIN domain-containing protein [Ignavibacteria bacterium]|nr:PIN domain-containing protein [Ignavibacteriota bacterium]
MLKFIDTNIFVYSFLNQGKEKQDFSTQLINDSINKNELVISGLILQELVYILSKNSIEKNIIYEYYDKLQVFSNNITNNKILKDANLLALKLNYFQHINDCIHIKFAETYCDKIITYDNDFEKFRKHTKLEIEILK